MKQKILNLTSIGLLLTTVGLASGLAPSSISNNKNIILIAL